MCLKFFMDATSDYGLISGIGRSTGAGLIHRKPLLCHKGQIIFYSLLVMYYRRKVILAILQKFEGRLESISFQKLLLIFTRRQVKPVFEFVPHRFGAYSFRAQADKKTLLKYDLIERTDDWVLKSPISFIDQLDEIDRMVLNDIYKRFRSYSIADLIRYTHREYPSYATRSDVAEKYLDRIDLEHIETHRPKNPEKKIYTIGYEGVEAETYMNRLLQKDIRLLVDVRKNSVSMKFGFSKRQLQDMCEKLDIRFVHMPELGIASEKRKELVGKQDYKKLFEEYALKTHGDRKESLDCLYNLWNQYDRIALTCFEREHTCCHRHKISDYMNQVHGIGVEHL